VLESIVGIDFLPRGSGVVTRRPLEMRLSHLSDNQKAWAVFPEEIPGQKFGDFDEVRKAIEGLTDKVCGKSKGIIDKPIVLQIFSHTCPDLTLIDLPGITRIPLAGSDQKENIEAASSRKLDPELTATTTSYSAASATSSPSRSATS